LSQYLQSFIKRNQPAVEEVLRARLPRSSLSAAGHLNEALDYALFPGGKRLRPMLSLLASDLVAVPRSQALTLACAVEFLHSSSLIIDDLPGMDDASLRRNRRTLHLVFGEGVAMLAALALLNESYGLFAEAGRSSGRPSAVESIIAEAARVIGAEGMIGGQAIDIELRTGCADAKTLAGRDLKTTALMRLMMTAGAYACGAEAADTRALSDFGECLGRAFQICDDLLDVGVGSEVTGKSAEQDLRHLRVTSVALLGIPGARRFAEQLVARGVARLEEQFGRRDETRTLAEAADLVLSRAGSLWEAA